MAGNEEIMAQYKHDDGDEFDQEGTAIVTPLTPAQKTGVAWGIAREAELPWNAPGGFVFDEAGCGKTLQMLAICHASECKAKRMAESTERSDIWRFLTKQATLVVCPANVLYQWKKEAEKHFASGTFAVYVHHGAARRRRRLPTTANLFLTTYETLMADVNLFGRYRFTRVVLDEAHRIRTQTAGTTRTAMTLSAHYRWLLTATPIWSGIDNLLPLMKFMRLSPELISNIAVIGRNFRTERCRRDPTYVTDSLRHISSYLSRYAIRRYKADAIPDLVDRLEYVVRVDPSADEKRLYDAVHRFSADRVVRMFELQRQLRAVGQGRMVSRANMGMCQTILRLRQTADHPHLILPRILRFLTLAENVGRRANPAIGVVESVIDRLRNLGDDYSEECSICMAEETRDCLVPCGHLMCSSCYEQLVGGNRTVACPFCRGRIDALRPVAEVRDREPEVVAPEMTEQERADLEATFYDRFRSNTKLTRLIGLLTDPARAGEKWVVFSIWTGMLDLMARAFVGHGIRYERLDGTMQAQKRSAVQETFTENPEATVVLASLTAVSEGINLQAANNVVFYDPWWTSSRVEQGKDRVHRIGQTRDVRVYHLLASGTVEERVFELQQRRRAIAEATLKGIDSSGRDQKIFSWEGGLRFILNLEQP